jgi:hypothetical protein
LSKNTRWALALVGVVIIIVAAVAIGTGGDNSDATLSPDQTEHSTNHDSGDDSSGGITSSTGATGKSDDSSDDNSGGAGPDTSTNDNSGGAGPGTDKSSSGGAGATVVVSPVLTTSGVKTVKVDKGETVTIRARSDKAGTLHVHGYNKMVELKPGQTGRVTFKANIDGEFEIELHYTGGETQVGVLRVSP